MARARSSGRLGSASCRAAPLMRGVARSAPPAPRPSEDWGGAGRVSSRSRSLREAVPALGRGEAAALRRRRKPARGTPDFRPRAGGDNSGGARLCPNAPLPGPPPQCNMTRRD